jgi:hypothetical protein
MRQQWQIVLDTQEQRRKVAMLEGRARQAGDPEAGEVEFSLTLFPDQVSLNLPASTAGREFIARLEDFLGSGHHGGHGHRPLGPAPRQPRPAARPPGLPGGRPRSLTLS